MTRSLGEIYMQLETGAITEEQFAAEEKQLLDRLDAIERRNQGGDEEANDESGDEFDEGEDDADDGEDASRDEPRALTEWKKTEWKRTE